MKDNRKHSVSALAVLALLAFGSAEAIAQTAKTIWPEVKIEMRPGTRWWWMGSAVDAANLTRNMSDYAKAGLGTLEITPIYGVQHNEKNELNFLSTPWMNMLKHTESEARRLNMQIDMNTGTGWPFGGPEVGPDDAACKMLIEEFRLDKRHRRLEQKVVPADKRQQGVATLERLMAFSGDKVLDLTRFVGSDHMLDWKAPKGDWRLIAVFCGRTFQKVKRSAPGGDGYVINHFSEGAVCRYLDRFTRSFDATGTKWPTTFFNDSYEVYGADYTKGLFDEFLKRRGYKLEEHLPELIDSIDSDRSRRLASDYRLVFAELLQENFTRKWTAWAHKHGAMTRNQAHGSPANLIDIYASVDIPEIEGFGLTDFKIKGLRRDSLTRPNFSDLSMLKYASSAAHIAGKRFTSSETFTWLTEHFRTSLSQMKPDMDLMFVSGVNHMFFHGTTYSPSEAPWPGWKFYASVNMNQTDNIWRDAPAFFKYITRCQSFLQSGKPDNDFLLYLPLFDMWYDQPFTEKNRLVLFDIHKMDKVAPRFIKAVHDIYDSGYDVDYLSDKYVRTLSYADGRLTTEGGTTYKAIVVPGVRLMPLDVLKRLCTLARQGAKVVFLGSYPQDVPGAEVTEAERRDFKAALDELKALQGGAVLFGTDYAETLRATQVEPERMVSELGLKAVRRADDDGYHYFVSCLKADGIDGWVPLAVNARSAMLFNPMNGESGKARLRTANGKTEVRLQLSSGESVIIKTFNNDDVDVQAWPYLATTADTLSVKPLWNISFVKAEPAVTNMPKQVTTGSWTDIDGAHGVKETMGTARYTNTFNVTKADLKAAEWQLDLGDVRESARVWINGHDAGVLFAVPYRCNIGKYLRRGSNTIEVEVTNLSANRIADMDRRGVHWRNFKDTNIVDLNYKKTPYTSWQPMPSGLLGPVRITKMNSVND